MDNIFTKHSYSITQCLALSDIVPQLCKDSLHVASCPRKQCFTKLSNLLRQVPTYCQQTNGNDQNSPYYAKAARRFDLRAVCAVGLCDTGTLTSEVRKATSIPEGIPLFTLQGGIDRSRLKGMDKLMISMLTKGLASQKQRSAQDERMLELLSRDESYVGLENLSEVLQWYREEQL